MNELIAPVDFDFSREHTIKFTLAADSRRSIFFFSPSRLTNRRKNGLNYVLQYTSWAPSLREGRDRAQAFFSQSD